MSKVYSLHMIALKAGANGPDFERYFREEIGAVPGPSGLTMRLLKGDRGDRKGNYLLMFEFESDVTTKSAFPGGRPGCPPDVGRGYAVDGRRGADSGQVERLRDPVRRDLHGLLGSIDLGRDAGSSVPSAGRVRLPANGSMCSEVQLSGTKTE